MPTTNKPRTETRDDASVGHRLVRLLESPSFARVVPHLPPETLHRVIQYRGLDACGELVASATPAQLNAVLDLDLWRRTERGADEHFDADRFGEWLEALADIGESVAARTVASLETRVVIAGLSRYLRVFDPGTFEPTESSDDEAIERHDKMNTETRDDAAECEVGGYLVRARRTDAWDAIVTLLVTLEAEHERCFHALMQGCRKLSNSSPEVDGLDDLMMGPEQYMHDTAIEREDRRSRLGYSSSSDARAFLRLARDPQTSPRSAGLPSNPIASAYFRALDDEAGNTVETSDAKSSAGELSGGGDPPASIGAAIEVLAEAGLMPERPRALLAASTEETGATKLPLLTRLLQFVAEHDDTAYFARSRELAFLANTLLAGCSVQSRSLTGQEAADAAAGICNLGLECWPGATPAEGSAGLGLATLPDRFLVEHSLVTAFEVGWSVLHRDVSLFVADQLISMLANLECDDAETRRGLRAFRRRLEKERQAGTPWLARDAAEVLATLDMTAWVSVLGLLDECPILPATLTAVIERRTTSVSPSAFEFITTTARIADIRVFMKMLPNLLSR